MIRAIKVLAVPAGREKHSDANAASAVLLGEDVGIVWRDTERIWREVLASVAPILCHAAVETTGFALCRIANNHAEAGGEGGDVDGCVVGSDVVDCHAAVLLWGWLVMSGWRFGGKDTHCAVEALIRHLWYALEGSVACAEVHDGCPVVGEVFSEGTCCA